MSSLYQLEHEYLELLEMLEDEEIDKEIVLDTLEGIKGEIEIKAENYVKVLKQLSYDAEMYRNESNIFLKKAQKLDDNINAMKDILKNALIMTGHESGLKTDLFTLKVAGNGGKKPLVLDVYPENLPVRFQKIEISSNNDAIRKYIEENGECNFAHLEERGNHLVIK